MKKHPDEVFNAIVEIAKNAGYFMNSETKIVLVPSDMENYNLYKRYTYAGINSDVCDGYRNKFRRV